MLSKETFCEALRKIQAQKDRDEQFSKALAMMGDGHFVFEGGALVLAALLDVLKEAVNDQYDYISWWLYDAAPDYEVWTDDEKTKWCLKEPEVLYDFIRDECQGYVAASSKIRSRRSNQMPKCCLYCRVDGASTESNRLAMNQQLTALRSLAGQLGFSISAEMLQYESGLDANRQSIRTLIRDARHGVYDRVLVMNGDRLARDAKGLAAIGEKLTAAGVRVYCPDGEIDLAPAYSHGYFRVATMEQTM